MAEPKKKIIIKKKTIIKKKKVVAPAAASKVKGLPEDTPAPTLKKAPAKKVMTKKKVQITKKKPASATQEAPPPEVISTSEIEPPPVERQKTMITAPPIGAPTHANEPEAKKEKETFKFYCIRCGQKLEAYYDWVGRGIGCPRCKTVITIPEPLP